MKKPICIGSGLVALDVILNGSPTTLPKLSAGGSCGNVISILGFLGWQGYPVARLADNEASKELLQDLNRWHIHTNFLSIADEGSTPIIIHRILKDKLGRPIHRFEFRDPATKTWLPQFKPITKDIAAKVLQENIQADVFYFDRINPGTFDLIMELKGRGSIIFFEPSSIKDQKQFEKFLSVSDIVKFSHDRIPQYKDLYASSMCFLEIETLGADGLLYRYKESNHQGWHKIPGFSIPYVQDAAGAGDWCTAGIIYALCANGKGRLLKASPQFIEDAMKLGQSFGAINCLYDGARGSMYFYDSETFLSTIRKFLHQKQISNADLRTDPQTDISKEIILSQLY